VNHELRMRVEHPPECPMCRGTESFPIGQLGRLMWFTCRYCGWQHSDKNCHVTECSDLTLADTQTTPADKEKGTTC
jgi:hypothetical protein